MLPKHFPILAKELGWLKLGDKGTGFHAKAGIAYHVAQRDEVVVQGLNVLGVGSGQVDLEFPEVDRVQNGDGSVVNKHLIRSRDYEGLVCKCVRICRRTIWRSCHTSKIGTILSESDSFRHYSASVLFTEGHGVPAISVLCRTVIRHLG